MVDWMLRRVPDGPRAFASAFRRVRRYELHDADGVTRMVTLHGLDSMLNARAAPADFWACVRAADAAFEAGDLDSLVEWPTGRRVIRP